MTFAVDSSQQVWQSGPTGITRDQRVAIAVSGIAQWQPGSYSQVEGAYPSDGFPNGHGLNLSDCPANASGIAVCVPTTGIQIKALSMVIRPIVAGSNPGTPTNGSGVYAVQPRWMLAPDGVTRLCVVVPSEMEAVTGTHGPWDIVFCYNDSNWADNVGSFTGTADVIQVDGQPAGQIISLPGHVTQNDIDNAQICSFSGLLTPGNRLRSVDGRVLADRYAPYKKPGPRMA